MKPRLMEDAQTEETAIEQRPHQIAKLNLNMHIAPSMTSSPITAASSLTRLLLVQLGLIQCPLRIPVNALRHGHEQQPLCCDDARLHVVLRYHGAKLLPEWALRFLGLGYEVDNVHLALGALSIRVQMTGTVNAVADRAARRGHRGTTSFPQMALASVGGDNITERVKAAVDRLGAEDGPVAEETFAVLARSLDRVR